MGRIKVGVIGGSFNPPTIGHIQLIELCSKYFDIIIVVPCNRHRQKNNLISNKHRIDMLKLIKFNTGNIFIEDNKFFIKLSDKSYELFKEIKHIDSNCDYYAIFGADNINNIKTYFNYEKLIEENNFCIVERKGYVSNNLELFKSNPNNIFIQNNDDIMEISSTEIRNNINNREYCSKYLTIEIYEFILKNHLYM